MNNRGWEMIINFAGIRAGTIILPLIFSAFLADQKSQWKGTITKEGDVIVVKNPREPLYKDNILTLKEELSIGGAAAEVNYALAQVRNLVVDDDENIYINDQKEVHIKAFDNNGKYLRTIGQKGQGPGDLSFPNRIAVYKPKNELMVQNDPVGFSFFSLDGKFLRNIAQNEAKGAFVSRSDSKGNFVLEIRETKDPNNLRLVLKKFTSEMKLISEITSSPLPSPYDLVAPQSYWDIDGNDNIVHGYPKSYEIQIISPQNKVIMRIMRDYRPVEYSKEEKEAQIKQLRDLQLPEDIIEKMNFAPNHSAYRKFIVDEQGRIFVENWEKTKDGQYSFYDIFDSEGKYLAKIPLRSKPALFKKGKLYSVEEDEEGYHVVKRYGLAWKIK
jgi:hypothetical protein